MNTKHTPGPWSIWTSNSFRRIVSDAAHREVLCGSVQRSDGHPDLHFPNGGHEGPDARLIAAAPELLECLIWAMREGRIDYVQRTKSNVAYCDAVDRARAVIAKATGEQS